MKRIFTVVIFSMLLLQSMIAQDLLISGIFDGPLSGGTPKGIEMYVLNDIPDMSVYGVGKATNGAATTSQTYTFPAVSATSGEYLYLALDSSNFNTFFGFDPNFTDGTVVNANGDDIIVLYGNSVEIDAYGTLGTDGTNQTWEYLDGWGYRIDGTGPDGVGFNDSNWSYSGRNMYDNSPATNADATIPFPIGTYSPIGSTALEVSFDQSGIAVDENVGQVTVLVNILNPDAANPTSVDVVINAASTADASDYTYATTTVTFPAGSAAAQMVTLDIIDDTDSELAETIVLDLMNPTNGAAFGNQTDHTITINENDLPAVTTDLVITEIMYNPPEVNTDSLEFLEIYNKGAVDLDLTGYTMSGVNFTFGAFTLTAGSYVLLAVNVSVLSNNYNINAATAFEWDSGSLSNGGEQLRLLDSFGSLVDEVTYDNTAPWPTAAAGDGASIELCAVTADNSLAENWLASSTATGTIINGSELFATPGAANFCPIPDPILEFALVANSVNEIAGTVAIEVTIVEANANPTTVDVALVAGTATEGLDFSYPATTTLTFPADSTSSQIVSIAITDDANLEGDETFSLELTNATNNAIIGTNNTTEITIIDDETLVVAFDTTGMVVNELDGTVLVDLTISDTGANATSVDVMVVAGMTDADGTTDYTFSDPTTVEFPGNDGANQSISIILLDDMIAENKDTLFLQLANPTNSARIGADSTFTLIINDDDAANQGVSMLISGVFDGPLPGGTKAVELYVLEDIVDISRYGLGAANNGGGTDGVEFVFPSVSAAAGDCITVTNNQANYTQYFGFPADYEDGTSAGINGNDAVELFLDTIVADVFGEITYSGPIAWDHLDGWAYRNNNTGPDGSMFEIANWTFTGINVLDDDTTNTTSLEMFPNCTYNPNPPLLPEFTFSAPSFSVGEADGSIDIEVLLSDSIDCTIDVALDLSTATVEDDFEFTDTTLTFSIAGPTVQTLTIEIKEDLLVEGDENIKLQLLNPSAGCALGTTTNANINIIDNDYNAYDIATVTTEDALGVADSTGILVELQGIVHYINYRPGGLDFTLIDATGGIAVFSFNNPSNYQVIPGDEILIQGIIGQFAGLTQIMPDNIVLVSSGNALDVPTVITALGEATESDVVRFECMTLVDTAQWTGAGNGFTVEISDGISTFDLFIDNDVPLYSQAAPLGMFNVQGIGRQRSDSSSAPFLDGYRLYGHRVDDDYIETCINANEDYFSANEIRLYPNPVNHRLTIETELKIEILRITNVLGQFVEERTDFEGAITLDVSKLPAGIYQATFIAEEQSHTLQFIRK